MEKIVLRAKFSQEDKERLKRITDRYEVVTEKDDEALKDAVAVIGNVSLDKIANNEKLRWVQLTTAGTEPYSLPDSLRDDIVITNTTGAFGLAISEHMIGCVFELYKKLNLYRDNQIKSLWLDRGEVKRIEGSRVLILGFGDIGRHFGEKMKALGCHITGISRTKKEKPAFCDELYTTDKIDSELPKADIVAMALPDSPETRGIIGEGRLKLMKSDAILINVGRGNAIDTDALTAALEKGEIGGCALDVTNPEPLPESHPLWKCENAVITPHVSGFFHLRDTYEMIVDICAVNIDRFARGEELINIVDKHTGYKSSSSESYKKSRLQN